MRKILSVLSVICLLVLAASVYADGTSGIGSITIKLDGFKNDNGSALIALCNSIEGFKNNDKSFRKEKSQIKDGKTEITIKDIPFGSYTVKVFHDENNNNKLDKGSLGIPKEAYGFSNNARSVFGPPKYEAALFTLDKAELTINITLK